MLAPLMWLAGVVLAGVLLSPPPPEAIRRAVADVYADPSVQRERPGAPAAAADDASRAQDGARRGGRGRSGAGGDPSFEVPEAVGGVASVLFWGAAALGVVLVLVALVGAWARRGARGGASGAAAPRAAPVPASPAGPAPPSLAEADALAAQGRYDEAVHVLLLRAVGTARAGGRAVPVHWTSREVCGGADLAPPSREALDVLVLAVERSLFGGRPLGGDDWGRCRAAAERMAAAPVEAAS